MKIKTSELAGAAFNWAVAKCEGLLCFGYCTDDERFAVEDSDGQVEWFMPTTSWAQGGPIIERERISPTYCLRTADWQAACHTGRPYLQIGPTPLIAAMRCYVASQLGDEMDVPDEFFDKVGV